METTSLLVVALMQRLTQSCIHAVCYGRPAQDIQASTSHHSRSGADMTPYTGPLTWADDIALLLQDLGVLGGRELLALGDLHHIGI
jgi:hypothetical protein